MSMFMAAAGAAQQNQSSQDKKSEKTKPAATKEKKDKKEQVTPPGAPDKAPDTSSKPAESSKPDSNEATDKDKEEHYDVSEAPPIITHHQISVGGKALSYTATTGRLPLKRGDGKIEAEMFFVAYTLDGQDAGRRPRLYI
jgi:carboxypeptidase C (cathepsin A)